MIRKLINEHATALEPPEGIDAEALLWAIYRSEKYDKHNRVPRYEPAFAPAGTYYASHVKELYELWGVFAACSYSNFQILFVTAAELGYKGPPLALDHDSVALPWVVRYLQERVLETGAKTVEEIADAYNSGTHLDGNVPTAYIKRFRHYYDIHLKELQKCRGTTEEKTD
jgi:hypothetical protein